MSKYILVVDLPGDGECDGCDLLDHAKARCKVTRTTVGTYFDGNEWHTICPSDCPLIPVERVIGSVFHLDASVQYGVSTDDVASALREELGVTE